MSSEQSGEAYELEDAVGKGSGDGGVPQGELIDDFVEAVCAMDVERTTAVREKLVQEIGEAAMVDISAVIAAFNCYPRIASTTGIPLDQGREDETEAMRAELGLNELDPNQLSINKNLR